MKEGNPRILIIDDEMALRKVLVTSLTANDFSVAEAGTGEAALAQIESYHPNLVILDLGLPDFHGSQVLEKLRRWTDVPVIIVTATDDEKTKVDLLEAGADDFLTKPFSVPELIARVRVALRHRNVEATPIFTSGDLSIDLNRKTVVVRGERAKVSATEFALLQRLIRQNGGVVSVNQLMIDVWGKALSDQVHYVRVYMGQLRKKIEIEPSNPVHLVTVPGIGYRLI